MAISKEEILDAIAEMSVMDIERWLKRWKRSLAYQPQQLLL